MEYLWMAANNSREWPHCPRLAWPRVGPVVPVPGHDVGEVVGVRGRRRLGPA
jgi:hypothetical protein